jgi:hypothetical protein
MTSKEVKQPTAVNSALLEERSDFTINLLKNPNYYGTFPGLDCEPKGHCQAATLISALSYTLGNLARPRVQQT